jgi:hypothetical protein
MAISIKEAYKKMHSSQKTSGKTSTGKSHENLAYAKINSDMKEYDRVYQKKVTQSYHRASKIVLTS